MINLQLLHPHYNDPFKLTASVFKHSTHLPQPVFKMGGLQSIARRHYKNASGAKKLINKTNLSSHKHLNIQTLSVSVIN